MSIEEISKQIVKNYDDAIAKAFVLSVWRLLKENGINVCLNQKEVDFIEEQRGNTTTWKRNYELDFKDIDTTEHDAKVRADALDEVCRLFKREWDDMCQCEVEDHVDWYEALVAYSEKVKVKHNG